MDDKPFKLSADTVRKHTQEARRIRRRVNVLSSVLFVMLFGWFMALCLWGHTLSGEEVLGTRREMFTYRVAEI